MCLSLAVERQQCDEKVCVKNRQAAFIRRLGDLQSCHTRSRLISSSAARVVPSHCNYSRGKESRFLHMSVDAWPLIDMNTADVYIIHSCKQTYTHPLYYSAVRFCLCQNLKISIIFSHCHSVTCNK